MSGRGGLRGPGHRQLCLSLVRLSELEKGSEDPLALSPVCGSGTWMESTTLSLQ